MPPPARAGGGGRLGGDRRFDRAHVAALAQIPAQGVASAHRALAVVLAFPRRRPSDDHRDRYDLLGREAPQGDGQLVGRVAGDRNRPIGPGGLGPHEADQILRRHDAVAAADGGRAVGIFDDGGGRLGTRDIGRVAMAIGHLDPATTDGPDDDDLAVEDADLADLGGGGIRHGVYPICYVGRRGAASRTSSIPEPVGRRNYRSSALSSDER